MFTPEDFDLIREQVRTHRDGRMEFVQVLSGVSGGTTNQFTEQVTGGTEVWVNTSGVVTTLSRETNLFPAGLQGEILPHGWRVSFNYDAGIIGLTHAKKVKIHGRTYNVEIVEEDYFGPHILHVDFILTEGL